MGKTAAPQVPHFPLAYTLGVQIQTQYFLGFPGSTNGKEPPASAGDLRDVGSIPGSGRCPGEVNDNTLQYSCLENPTDIGTWQAIVHRVAKRWTRQKQLNSQGFGKHFTRDMDKSVLPIMSQF